MSPPPAPSPGAPAPDAPAPGDLLKREDLSVTALYTAQTWAWAGFEGARVFETDQSRGVFGATNLFLGLAGLLRGAPSLPKGLAQRHALIDALARRAGHAQVLELAAGLSARGLRWAPEARYTEVDLPHVVAHKRALLAAAGRAPREGHSLIGADLRLEGAAAGALDLGALLTPAPATLIAEGLLMYLTPDEQRALWRRAASALRPRGGVLLFDLVPPCEQPPPGWVGRGLGWLMRRFTGGRAFTVDARGREALREELRAAGFEVVRALDTSAVARAEGLPWAGARTQQVVWAAEVAGAAEGA